MADVIEAAHASRCTICDRDIDPGDQIVCVEDEWVHAGCAEREGWD